MSLVQRSISAARWVGVSTAFRAGVQLAQVAVLARMLSPEDFGLMAMATIFLGFAALFGDMGLGAAYVQRRNISAEQRSSLYWLNIGAGACLAVLVMAASPLVAWYFREERLVPLVMITATNFPVAAMSQQLRMNAEKSLRFGMLAVIETAAACAGFLAAVWAAMAGWGVYALVAGTVAGAWTVMILSWLWLAEGWRPLRRMRWGDVQPFLRFGGGIVLNSFINHVNLTLDLILSGRLLGAGQLGLYSIPRSLVLQVQFTVNPVVTRVGFPLIASIQHDLARVREVYLKTMNMTASVNTPIYVALAAFAPEVVAVLLGGKWVDAGPLLRVMAAWGLLRSFGSPIGTLLFGMGRVGHSVRWNAALLLVLPPAVWLGASHGAMGVAYALSGVMAVLFIPAWFFLVRPVCGAGLADYARQVAAPLACALAAAAAALAATMPVSDAIWRLAIGLPLGGVIYLAGSWLLNREWLASMARAAGIGRTA